MKMRLNLNAYLNRTGITAYRLSEQLKGRVARATVYATAKTPQQRIDLDTVSDVLSGLFELTGQPVTLTDLLEVVADPIPLSVQDPLELTGAATLQATLETLEIDTPPAELQGWLERFKQTKQLEQAGA